MTSIKVPPLIGFHAGAQGNYSGITEDYFKPLDSAGIPIVIKQSDGFGLIYEVAQFKKNSGVNHCLTYRISTAGANDGKQYDVPDYSLTPKAAASKHWQASLAKKPPELADYKQDVWWELTNEIDRERADWVGYFSAEIALLALAAGYKVALPGWASGNPEPEHWAAPGMLKFLGLAASVPDRVAVSVHEYNTERQPFEEVYPHNIGRFQDVFNVCDRHGIGRPSILITEFGWSLNSVPTWPEALPFLNKAAALYARHPEILGAAIWNLGKGPEFGDVHNQTQRLIKPLAQWVLNTRFDQSESQPAPPPAEDEMFFPPVKEIVLLVPPDLNATERHILVEWAHNGIPGHTQGTSSKHGFFYAHTTAINTVLSGKPDSVLYVVEGQRIGSGLNETWLRQHVPQILDTRRVVFLSLPSGAGPQISIEPLSQRDPRWSGINMGG